VAEDLLDDFRIFDGGDDPQPRADRSTSIAKTHLSRRAQFIRTAEAALPCGALHPMDRLIVPPRYDPRA
jgi:hypothetical protein